MRHRTLAILAATVGLLSTALPAHAVGTLVDVEIVDRDTGEMLKPILHQGEWWIAGRPGARYGVTLLSRQAQRTLSVVSIDGVNAISGDTAAWSQSGYVLGAYQRTQIDGWRKNMNQVAAFEFTALPDSYAARTDRPANVGVIGIAVFREWRRPAPVVSPAAAERATPSTSESSRAAPSAPMAKPAAPPSNDDAAPAQAARAEAEPGGALLAERRERLGTGHGAIEASSIRYTAFERARPTPNEIVTIRYDRAENLVAMGILPAPRVADRAMPDAFPNSGRFVADPPPR